MPKGGFGFATEADADSFTIDTQYYLCTELDFADADPHFGATGVGGIGAQKGATGMGSGIGTAKNLHTPDGGRTWLVDLITLPAMNPQGPQTPPPTYDCSGSSGSSGTGGASGSGAMAGAGGAHASGAAGSGGTHAATGGTLATAGTLSTGGNVSVATGGTPGTGGRVANAGGAGATTNTGGTTSATGVSTTPAGSGGNAAAGSSAANGGNSALAGNSSMSPSSSSNRGSCSCSAPGHNAPTRGLFALALAGAALPLRSRRRRSSHASRGRASASGARPQIVDTELQEAAVIASGLDWVLVQPVHLTDGDDDTLPFVSTGGETGKLEVSRKGVGRFLAHAVTDSAWVGHSVALSGAKRAISTQPLRRLPR
jgi:MYXO-CTERM domain-containing protein